MKMITLLGIGLLAFTFGCQSAAPPIETRKVDTTPQETAKAEPPAADDHDHAEHDENKAPRISLDDAKKAFDDGKAVFVDTRAATFYENEHIKGAINVPSADFENAYSSIPKGRKIITYCS